MSTLDGQCNSHRGVPGDQIMPEKLDHGKFNHSDDEPLSLDAVQDELGRVPIIGPASDRELFLDLPSAGLTSHIAECREPVEREFLTNDFSL